MATNPLDHRLTTPLYEPAFAARMLEMTPARVRRWLMGYTFRYHPRKGLEIIRDSGPLIQRGAGASEPLVSFVDLVELYFAKAFLDHGISIQKMRKALAEAQQLVGVDHPFARQKFFTAGREIFLQLQDERQKESHPHLLHLLRNGQWAIADVVLQYAKRLDFEPVTGEAVTWWPLGKLVPVCVDARVGYGEPTIAHRGIKTAIIYDLYKAEKKRVDVVARWMRIEPREVEAAVRWENRLETLAA